MTPYGVFEPENNAAEGLVQVLRLHRGALPVAQAQNETDNNAE